MKKILLVILGMFLLGFIFNEITGEKFPIGSTMLHDSTSVFTFNNNVKINGYMESKGRKVESGQTAKIRIIRDTIQSTVNTYAFYPHGVADYTRIVGIDWVIYDVGTSKDYHRGYNLNTLYKTDAAYINAGNIAFFLPSGATGLTGDTITFVVTYIE